jgi:hypothetical protein
MPLDFWTIVDNLIAIGLATTPLDVAIFVFVRRTRAAVTRANRMSNLAPDLTAEEEVALKRGIRRVIDTEVELYRKWVAAGRP